MDSVYPMQAGDDGWFSLALTAAVGNLYRYRIDGKLEVPDPASRYQPDDVHGCSQVVDPESWSWADSAWRGRPWHEAVLYELHVGCFTPAGTFSAVIEKLDYLSELGITAIQLMPIADFPGRRNWGYDGVLPFAPDSRYGTPDHLKQLVQSAHAKGMMVFLDVVYNHFGPEGNYLHHYAGSFFSKKQRTPWGKAFNFDGRQSRWVRQFFIHNALYWLEEFHLDGLRFDAVQAMFDQSEPQVLEELASAVRRQFGERRQIHLILENDDNAPQFLRRDELNKPLAYSGQWNDDFHHALHVLLTGESWGYYRDYADKPMQHLARCLTQGFAYQGEVSAYRQNTPRGDASGHLPPLAFINFLQNHDQIGNRPFAERIHELAPAAAMRVVTAILMLAPFPPMLFMGQEWGSRQPFHFFCDFEPHLAKRIKQARRRGFTDMPGFATAKARAAIPDPAQAATFQASILNWGTGESADGPEWLAFHRQLLSVRQREITPHLPEMALSGAQAKLFDCHALQVEWQMRQGVRLRLLANLGARPVKLEADPSGGRLVFACQNGLLGGELTDQLPPWSVFWAVDEKNDNGECRLAKNGPAGTLSVRPSKKADQR